jgi:hypothetical protein
MQFIVWSRLFNFLTQIMMPLLIILKLVKAISKAGVKKVLHLRSIGAHLDYGTGIILGHHSGENVLKQLPIYFDANLNYLTVFCFTL